ncbi:MAG: zinc-ribbon domain-containing protein [Bacilli bacterium]|nr:zinc-ribbon domain-containing protein [Bacilli bacterium]
MYCPKCGEKNNENVKYCSKCGASLTEGVKETNNKKEGLGTASLVIGIISLILSFTCIILFPIFITIPLSIIGLILGIVNKVKKGKKISGIILNVFAFIISIICFIISIVLIGALVDEASNNIDNDEFKKSLNQFYNELDRSTSDNYVAGKYNCKSFDGSGEKGDYIVRFELNNDNTFMWGKYNETDKNYVKGTYTFTDLDKTNGDRSYAYYNVKLDGDEYYNEGIKQEEDYNSEYEFGITAVATKKQGILMNTKTYNMYYCYEEK